jgi:ankyrin repeat protein
VSGVASVTIAFNDEPRLESATKSLFQAIEANDTSIFSTLDAIHDADFALLCKVGHYFQSEWSAPELELQTAFQRACLLGRTSFVQWMIQKGNVSEQILAEEATFANSFYTRRPAMIFACQSGSNDVIELLLKHGASANSWGSCSNYYAARTFQLKEKDSCSHKTTLEHHLAWTTIYAIHFMIVQDNTLFERFVTEKTSIQTTDYWHTALHLACLFNRPKSMIDALLAAKVDPAATTKNGKYADEFFVDPKSTTLLTQQYLREKRQTAMNVKEEQRRADLENAMSENNGANFQIFICTFSNRTLTIMVNKDETVNELQHKLSDRLGIPTHTTNLLCKGKLLRGNLTLHQYDIRAGTIIFVLQRMTGGNGGLLHLKLI